MKYLILLIMLVVIGCESDTGSTHHDVHQNDIKFRYGIVKLDECEYIQSWKPGAGERSRSLTHKGNCSNPIHKYGE